MATLPDVVAVGDPTKAAAYGNTVRTALSDLDADISALTANSVIKNGNFEIDDGGAPAEPLNWTFSTESAGGSNALNTTTELSGTQSIRLTTDATNDAQERMLSDKVRGGNLGIDISFQMRRTAACPDLEVRLMEYNTAGSLVNSPGLLLATIAGAGSGINTDVEPVVLDGLTGIGTQFAIQFDWGMANPGVAGSVDIDYVAVKTTPGIISRQEFEVTSGGGGFQEGWIYIDSAYTSVDVDIWMAGIVNDTANVEINGTNGTTISVAGAVGERNDSTGTSVVTVGAWGFPGIFTFKIETTGWQAKTTMGNSNGLKDGLVFTP